MKLSVDAAASVPPYEQIRGQLASLIAVGALTPGTQLPPIRQLAGDLGLSAGTVARAYQELEREGLVAGGGRRGTVVHGTAREIESLRQRELRRAAQTYADRISELGVLAEDAVAEVARVVHRRVSAETP